MTQLSRGRAALDAVLAAQINSLVRQRGADRQVPRSIAAENSGPATHAVENFPISGQPLSCMPELVPSLAFVKKAAALLFLFALRQ